MLKSKCDSLSTSFSWQNTPICLLTFQKDIKLLCIYLAEFNSSNIEYILGGFFA